MKLNSGSAGADSAPMPFGRNPGLRLQLDPGQPAYPVAEVLAEVAVRIQREPVARFASPALSVRSGVRKVLRRRRP